MRVIPQFQDVIRPDAFDHVIVPIYVGVFDGTRQFGVCCCFDSLYCGTGDELWGFTGQTNSRSNAVRIALTRGLSRQIDLYSPVDPDPHKQSVKLLLPTLVDFRLADIGVGLWVSGPHPFEMSYDFQFSKQVNDTEGVGQGGMFGISIEQWNSRKLPIDPGENRDLADFGDNPHIENSYRTIIPFTKTINPNVRQELYFGQMPIIKVSRFKDEFRGGTIRIAFGVDIVSPDEVAKNWRKISDICERDLPPVFVVQGLGAWDERLPQANSVAEWKKSDRIS